VAATVIVAAWKMGVRNRIKLAHVAIKAVEQNTTGIRETHQTSLLYHE
jgi:hypothetical protein